MTDTKYNVISPDKVGPFLDLKTGPFVKGMRVACPLKRFGQRHTTFCANCEFFQGIIKKEIKGEFDRTDPKMISRCFGIYCDHPIGRSLSHFPED